MVIEQVSNTGAAVKAEDSGSDAAERQLNENCSEEYCLETSQRLQKAEQHLKSLEKSDTLRPKALLGLVESLTDYAVLWTPILTEHMLRALDLAIEAYDTSLPDDFWRGSALFSQSAISFTMYDATGKVEWLSRGEELGLQAVDFMEARKDSTDEGLYNMFFARRNERLADGLKAHFDDHEHGGRPNLLEYAVSALGKAVDALSCTVHNHPGAEETPRRFLKWSRWCVLLSDFRENTKSEDSLIDLAQHKAEDYMGSDEEYKVVIYSLNLIYLLSRRWARTREDSHYEALCNAATTYWTYLEKDSTYAIDPTDRTQLIRAIFLTFLPETENSLFREHLPTLETAIALLEETFKQMGRWHNGHDLKAAYGLIGEQIDLLSRRYAITNLAEHGWQLDDVNFCSSSVNVRLSAMKDYENGFDQPIVQDGPITSATYGTSAVTGEEFWAFPGADPDEWKMRECRFVFKARYGDIKIQKEDWICGFGQDGKWIMGVPVQGKDDDVLEFLENRS